MFRDMSGPQAQARGQKAWKGVTGEREQDKGQDASSPASAPQGSLGLGLAAVICHLVSLPLTGRHMQDKGQKRAAAAAAGETWNVASLRAADRALGKVRFVWGSWGWYCWGLGEMMDG